MATKLEVSSGYLLDFANGQGVGRSAYSSYPPDLDTNFGLIRISLNQLIDEVNASRLIDNTLALDALTTALHRSALAGYGRFSPSEARVTFSGANVTVSSGRIYVGRKITVTGATLGGTGSAGSRYVAVNEGGILSIATTSGTSLYDIAEMTWNGSAFTAIADDMLDPSANAGKIPLASGDVANFITHRTDGAGALVGLEDPSIRCVGNTGTLQDGGLAHAGSASRFSWVSRRATAEGSGAAVQAATFHELGQLRLHEQARAIATGTAVAGGTGGSLAALNLDTAIRREPATYIANPFITPTANAMTCPTGGAYDGTYVASGWVLFPSGTYTYPIAADIVMNGVSIARARVGIATGGESGDAILSLSGLGELAASQTVQIRATHAGGAITVDARLGIFMLGGS